MSIDVFMRDAVFMHRELWCCNVDVVAKFGLTLTFLFGSLVPIAVGLILGHSRVGQCFVEVLMVEYEGRLLTTDIECEVVSSLDNSVVLGSNWLFAWREVWRSQLG
jgi:hypothetical protein